MTCQIPYIDNSALLEADKEVKKELHLNSVRELLQFQGLNFKTLVRKIKKDGQTYSIIYAPSGSNQQRFDDYVENSTYLKDTLKFKSFKGKQIIVIDTLEDTELSQDFTNPLLAEEYLDNGFNKTINNKDIDSIVADDESRKKLYDIISKQSDRIDLLIKDPNIDSKVREELSIIKSKLNTDNGIYELEASTNFLRSAINFSNKHIKNFDKNNSSNYLNQLKEIEKLPTFEERKTARAVLTREVDDIKNRFYIFGSLNDIADQLAFNSIEPNDVFEIYNRYSIQKQLETIRVDQTFKDSVAELISTKYANKLELLYQIENLNTGLTRAEIEDLLDKAVFGTMKDRDGNIKPTLLSSVKQAQDQLTDIQNGTKQFLIDAQVDLLYDTYLTYLPQQDTAFAKQYAITKDKIRNSILQANGDINMVDYGLKHGDQLPDEVIALFTTLLQSTVTEADYEAYNEVARISEKFNKEEYKGKELEFGDAMTTYTFEVVNKAFPQFYEKIEENGETFLTYSKMVEINGIKVPEVKKFLLPEKNVYGRYFKLNPNNDDTWAYRTDQGYYIRVSATKALEGKNKNHRIEIEDVVVRSKMEEMVDSVYNGEDLVMYDEEGLTPTIIRKYDSNGKLNSEKRIRGLIKEAFRDRYINNFPGKESIEKINEIYSTINSLNERDKAEVIKNNFYRSNFQEKSWEFFDYVTTKQVAEDTYYAAISINNDSGENEYLVQLRNGQIIPIKVQIEDSIRGTYTITHNGKLIPQSNIDFILRKGKSFQSNKSDKVLNNPKFNDKLISDSAFANFYRDTIEEYDKLVDKDSSGFLHNGKIGQVTTMDNKTLFKTLRDFVKSDTKKADLQEGSYNAIKKILGEELTQEIPKTNEKGENVDYNGKVLPPGAKPIMIKRTNIDRLEVGTLKPTFSNRIYDQNLVTNNIFANLLAMNQQAIHFNKMYELEPQMRFALLLSQGSSDLSISPRQVQERVKGKGKKEYEIKAAKQAERNLRFIINAYGYGNATIEDSFAKNTTVGKVIEFVRKPMFFQSIALNFTAAIPNYIIGQTNNHLIASGKRFGLDSKLITKASRQIHRNILPIVSDMLGNTTIPESHYIVKLAHIFKGVAGLTAKSKSLLEKETKLENFLSMKTFYWTTSVPEIGNQLPLMLAYLQGMQLTKGGTMYEAIRIDGKKLTENHDPKGKISFINQDNTPVSEKEIVKATREISKLTSAAQGDYGENQKVQAANEFLPSLGLTYARWVYPYLRARFSKGKKLDIVTGEEDFGGFQRIFNANIFGSWNQFNGAIGFGPEENVSDFVKRVGIKGIGKVAKEGSLGGLELLGRTIGAGLTNMPILRKVTGRFNDKLLKIKDINSPEFLELFDLELAEGETAKEFEERKQKAYDFYVNSLETAAREYGIFALFTLIGLIAAALGDDDDEEKTAAGNTAKYIEVFSRRLVSDLSLGTPVLAPFKGYDFITQRSKDPLVLLKTIKVSTDFIGDLVGFQTNISQGTINFNIDDVYEKSGNGYEKGDLKLGRSFFKAFGALNQFHRIASPEEQDNYIKMINKGEIFTDKDLNEKEEE